MSTMAVGKIKYLFRLGGAISVCLMLGHASISTGQTERYESNLVDPNTPLDAGPKDATLVFSDEFNASRLDSHRWNLGLNAENTLHGMLDSSYRMENVDFIDGKLRLTARHHPKGVLCKRSKDMKIYGYSSGAVNTNGKFYLRQNMYVEARVKLPINEGGYCVFSAIPSRNHATTFTDPRERMQLHFFEYVANENQRMFASLIWFNDYLKKEIPSHLKSSEYIKLTEDHYVITADMKRARWIGDHSFIPVLDWYEWYEWNDYVTVGFKATPSQLEWYISEKGPVWQSPPYMVFQGGRVAPPVYLGLERPSHYDAWQRSVPACLENSLILDFSLREASWAGGPIDKEQLPAYMLVDYIRVYEFN